MENTKNPASLSYLLTQVGFLASDCTAFSIAEKIFEALKAYKPDSETPYIGSGYNLIMQGKFDEAISLLKDKALKINPNSAPAKTYLGLALGSKGEKDQCKKILEDVITNHKDSPSVNFAKLIPEFLGIR